MIEHETCENYKQLVILGFPISLSSLGYMELTETLCLIQILLFYFK